MRPPIRYVDLARELRTPSTNDEIDPSFDDALVRFSGAVRTWATINARWVIVLGEGGTGKSTELRARSEVLRSAGEYAFFAPLPRATTEGMGRVLGRDAEKLEEWLSGSATATILLDELDEARVYGLTLEDVLGALEHDLGVAALRRSRIVISCRPSEWRPTTDLAVFRQYTSAWADLSAGESDIEVLSLMPLDLARARRLAACYGVVDADAFVTAIEDADLEDLAGRPLDLEWLATYWADHKQFGSLFRMVSENVDHKLVEVDPKSSPLSLAEAREGAGRLATIATLCARRSFQVRDAPTWPEQPSDDLVIARALHDWDATKIANLLRRPLFDESAAGRVRIHIRAVEEFLCARWLEAQKSSGRLTSDDLRRVLQCEHHDVHVREHLVRAAAWWAVTQDEVRSLLVRTNPEQLLDEGDPGSLPLPDREAALRAFVSKYDHRDRFSLSLSRKGLRRFGDPSLAPVVLELLKTAKSEDVRERLFKLVASSRMAGCADHALATALDTSASDGIRFWALGAAAEAGTDHHRRELCRLVEESKTLDLDVCGYLVEHLYPTHIGLADLERLLSGCAPRGRANKITRMDHALRLHLIERGPKHQRRDLFQLLVRAAGIPSDPREDAEHAWLTNSVVELLVLLVSADPTTLSWEPIDATLTWLESQAWHHGRSSPIRGIADMAAENTEVRRLLIQRQVRLRKDSGERLSAFTFFGSPFFGSSLDESDWEWLAETARGAAENSLAQISEEQIRTLRASPAPSRPVPRENVEDSADVELRTQLSSHVEELRSGTLRRALQILVDRCSSFDDWGTVDINLLATVVGKELAEAAKEGLKTSWSRTRVSLPSEGSDTSTPGDVVLGLVGLNLAYADGLDLDALSREDAISAARLAVWELNRFPQWLPGLVDAHGREVIEVLVGEAVHELRSGISHERVLQKLVAAPRVIQEATADLLAEDLARLPSPALSVLRAAAELLVRAGKVHLLPVGVLAQNVRGNVDNPAVSAAWWLLWLERSPADALAWLDKAAEGTVVIANAVYGQLFEWADEDPPISMRISTDDEALAHLHRHLCRFIDEGDDSFSAKTRLQRQVVEWLTKRPESARSLFLQLADDPRLAQRRSWHLALADRLVASLTSCAPMSRSEAVEWIRNRRSDPRSERELFEVSIDRFADVATFLREHKFSYRELFQRQKEERPFQLWIAAELRLRAVGQYSVTREEEVAHRKKPDVCLHNPEAGPRPVSIEIKLLSSWTLNQLDDALASQLVGQYMQNVNSRYGLFVLCADADGFKINDGKRLTIHEVKDRLTATARRLVSEGRVEGLDVVLLDFGAPVRMRRSSSRSKTKAAGARPSSPRSKTKSVGARRGSPRSKNKASGAKQHSLEDQGE